MPEDPPAKPDPAFAPKGKAPERPGSVGSPQAPSQGGDGEVKKSIVEFKSQPSALDKAIQSVVEIFSPNIQDILNVGQDEYDIAKSMILDSIFSEEDKVGMGDALKVLMSKTRFGEFKFDGLERELLSILDGEGLYAVNVERHVEDLKQRIQSGFSEFVGKAIVYTLIDAQFPEVPEMQERIGKSLGEYAYAFVAMEIQKTLDDIRETSLELPETLRVRSVIRNRPLPPNITVEAPQISLPAITVTVPERETRVYSSPPDITVNVPEQKSTVNITTPDVTVNVPEQKSEIVVNVPEQSAPIVNLNVPEQPAPVIEVKSADVNVTVQPTPVEITNPVTVNVPRPIKEQQTVHRNINGDIDATETNIIYDEGQ